MTDQRDEREVAAEFLQLINLINAFTRIKLHSEVESFSARAGLTFQRFCVLYSIELFPGKNLKQMAATLGVTSSSLSIMIDSLVNEGLVSRDEDPEDRRRIIIGLTERGREILEEGRRTVLDRLERWVLTFQGEEKEGFYDSCRSLIGVISREVGQPG